MARAATLTPGCTFLRVLSMTPSFIRRITPSVIASVWRPRCWWCLIPLRTAFGMPPTPICRQAPSGIWDATLAPMAASMGVGSPNVMAKGATSHRTAAVILLSWMRQSPYRYGMLGLTSAMTTRATSAAATAMSAEMPKLQYPFSSGGEQTMNATSTGISPRRNMPGTSPRNRGVMDP